MSAAEIVGYRKIEFHALECVYVLVNLSTFISFGICDDLISIIFQFRQICRNIQSKINIVGKLIADGISFQVKREQLLLVAKTLNLKCGQNASNEKLRLFLSSITPSTVSMKLLPKFSRTNCCWPRLVILRISFWNSVKYCNWRKESRFSISLIELNERSSSRSSLRLSRFSILVSLLHFSDSLCRFKHIQIWSIFKIFKNSRRSSVMMA